MSWQRSNRKKERGIEMIGFNIFVFQKGTNDPCANIESQGLKESA